MVPIPVSVVPTMGLVVLALKVKVSAPSNTLSLAVATLTVSAVTPAGTVYTPPSLGFRVRVLPPDT